MSKKIERIASILQKEISYILANEIKDKNIEFVTVTAVKVTNDLSYAKVYVTILNQDKKEQIMKALKKASGFIRTELADKLEIRHIPELNFVYDESIEYGNRIENIIDNLHNQEN
ncbi:MAG: 30S ribosome-binding factor RbfA [Mollicutes bacterium]|jgi:ribosome-binding factor A|nr:30S ribosome-binding factor RbfA [Mollicutes bacterium]